MCDSPALLVLNHYNIAPPPFVHFSRGNYVFKGRYILLLITYLLENLQHLLAQPPLLTCNSSTLRNPQ